MVIKLHSNTIVYIAKTYAKYYSDQISFSITILKNTTLNSILRAKCIYNVKMFKDLKMFYIYNLLLLLPPPLPSPPPPPPSSSILNLNIQFIHRHYSSQSFYRYTVLSSILSSLILTSTESCFSKSQSHVYFAELYQAIAFAISITKILTGKLFTHAIGTVISHFGHVNLFSIGVISLVLSVMPTKYCLMHFSQNVW